MVVAMRRRAIDAARSRPTGRTRKLGADAVTALEATSLQDGTACTGGHPCFESVLLCPTARIWLEGALHVFGLSLRRWGLEELPTGAEYYVERRRSRQPTYVRSDRDPLWQHGEIACRLPFPPCNVSLSTPVDNVVDDVGVVASEELVENVDQLWENCSEALRGQVSEMVWTMFLSKITPVDLRGDVLRLAVPDEVVRDQVVSRFLPLITESLAVEGEEPFDVEVFIDELLCSPVVVEEVPEAPVQRKPSPVRPTSGTLGSNVGVDPRFTFDNFVSASSNRLACSAAQATAEVPGAVYNPLFIYGASGLGKTHLLHAIGNYILENYRGYRVLYVTTETFLNDYVDAIRVGKSAANFKKHYRECDVLLIDDVQFMQNKEGLQEELFHTYNDLKQAGKQIVLTSDRAPKSIEDLEDRLRSRLLAGLLVEIDPPDLETRLAILRTKAERETVHVPDDVLNFIATNVRDNIRELEGALTRVVATARIGQQPITLALAQTRLADLIQDNATRTITPDHILEAVAETYGFTVEELIGPKRVRPLVTARHVAMYLVRSLTEYSYPMMGRVFGGRDHTTCINACNKIEGQMSERKAIYDQVTKLEAGLRNSAYPVETGRE